MTEATQPLDFIITIHLVLYELICVKETDILAEQIVNHFIKQRHWKLV